MTTERLNAVDAAWLRMDTPTNRMMITNVLVFDDPIDVGALGRLLEERLLPHQRFVQRIVDTPRGPAWALDPDFDLRSHLLHVALPAPGDRAALTRLTSDLMSSALDRARPLWQVHVVDGLAGGGSALIIRLHHCIGDGVALVRLLLTLTDDARAASPRHVGMQLPHAEGLVARARLAATELRSAIRLVTLPPDPATVLSERLGVRKHAAWSSPLPLGPIDERARAAGVTFNDLVLAAVTGALREYLESRRAYWHGLEVRAMLPVNLRNGDPKGRALGNRFGLVYLPLPLGERDPAARLAELKRRMDEVKASPDAVVAFGVLGLLGLATLAVERFGIELFTRKSTLLATNVPGPPEPVHLMRRRLAEMIVFAPASGRMGVTLSILTYGGAVQIGVASDEHVMPDPETFIAAIERELSPPLGAAAGRDAGRADKRARDDGAARRERSHRA